MANPDHDTLLALSKALVRHTAVQLDPQSSMAEFTHASGRIDTITRAIAAFLGTPFQSDIGCSVSGLIQAALKD